jgi:hypothetical protein
MSDHQGPQFRLVPLDDLLEHEEIDHDAARALAQEIARAGQLADPIWVAEGTGVILNGHHRVSALRELGAARAPAWVIDYDSTVIELERWSVGPEISKAEVVQRAQEHRLFPPKTTRHKIAVALPVHVTPLASLMPDGIAPVPPRQRRTSGRSRSSGAGITGST